MEPETTQPIYMPLHDKVIARFDEAKDRTEGGVLLTPTLQEQQRSCTGTVVAIGPGRMLDNGTLIPCSVNVGDRIVWGKYSGTPLDGTDDLLTLRDDDILAVIEGEALKTPIDAFLGRG